jgi:hypothetical protein
MDQSIGDAFFIVSPFNSLVAGVDAPAIRVYDSADLLPS